MWKLKQIMLLMMVYLFCTSELSAKETILVYVSHLPPFNITNGKDKGNGIIDKAISTMQEKVKGEFSLSLMHAPFSRFLNDAAGGKKVCNFTMRKNKEREKYLNYSIPYVLSIGNGLVIGLENINNLNAYIEANDEIDLQKALNERALNLWVQKGRSYDPYIDELIKANSEVTYYSKTGQMGRVIQVVLRDEVAGFITYPAEVVYHNQNSMPKKHLKYLRIKNSMQYSMAHLACSKGDWSNNFIEEMNKHFKTYRKSKDLVNAQLEWLPKNLWGTYREIVEKEFR